MEHANCKYYHVKKFYSSCPRIDLHLNSYFRQAAKIGCQKFHQNVVVAKVNSRLWKQETWRLDFLSTCHFVNLPICKMVVSSICCHFVNLLFCQCVILTMMLCLLAMLSTYNFVSLQFCQLAILSTCHFVNLPFCQLDTLSTCNFVNLQFCKPVILSLLLLTCSFVN